jgi:predicted RNA-binding Zn-ribbon protein involved in translation (DUF1610 family)
MSLTKFFQIIDRTFIGKVVDRQLNVLENTDPDRIYVENIRSFYHIPFKAARFFCEMAVKEHLFRKRYAVNCPNCGRVILSVDNKAEIPTTIKCKTCELDEQEEYEWPVSRVHIQEFYQLIQDPSTN